MTEDQKHELQLHLMSTLESIDAFIAQAEAIQHIELSDMTPETWELYQQNEVALAEFLALMKRGLIPASKVIDNNAAYDHVTTVMLAP